MAAQENSSMSVYDAFKKFKERFLEDKKSIFSDSDDEIFNKVNIKFIDDNFNKNPNENSELDFDQKIRDQLKNATQSQKILFAHAIWLWFIFAHDMKQDGKVEGIGKLIGDWNNYGIIPDHGAGNTGQYHKTNKPSEIAYVINFLEKVLNGDDKPNYVTLVKEMGNTFKSSKSEGKVAMYNILLHLFEPNNYEPIASYGNKEKIVGFFKDIFDDLDCSSERDLDDKLKDIRARCESDDNFKNMTLGRGGVEKFQFFHKELSPMWRSEIVLESKNMILHGAPGTGKTYGVENSIKNRLNYTKQLAKQYTLVQFHPSYGYEDFIDGIKPAGIDSGGSLKFELVNGQFKEICIAAFRELIESYKAIEKATSAKEKKEIQQKIKKFYFVADEVNRAELSRVFGELLLCVEEDKRLHFKDGKLCGTKVTTQNSKLWKKEHAVVILNSEGKLSDADSGTEFYFGIPENLYFIGTMNDIDRSVDSFDMALRRRFFWKHFECDYDVIEEKYSAEVQIEHYITACRKLNQYIVNLPGLSESYQLGHSYFLEPEKINPTQLNKVWESNIAPLLKEYLRAEYKENEIQAKLDEAKKIFKLPEVKKSSKSK